MPNLPQRKQSTREEAATSDAMLLKQSLGGDVRGFEALVNRYRGPLLKYIRRVLKDDEQANDVLQCVLLRLYTSLTTLKADGPLQGWLFQVAYHRCLDELRKRRMRNAVYCSEFSTDEDDGLSLIETIQDPGPLPEEIVEQLDLRAAFQLVIYSLPPRVRPVVHLRCFRLLSFSEIGRTLQMPEATAKTHFYRALPRLRAALSYIRCVS